MTTGYLDDWFINEPHEHHRINVPLTQLRAAHHKMLRRITSTKPVIEFSVGTDTLQALRAIPDLPESSDQAEPAR
ncbi:MAG: hypothetical protein ACRDRS_16150 [Pseudonocardiaceae bacterium]